MALLGYAFTLAALAFCDGAGWHSVLGTRVVEVGRRLRGGLLLGSNERAEGLC